MVCRRSRCRARMLNVATRALRSGTVRQYLAGSIASLSVLMCGTAFTWLTQILGTLESPDSEVPMTKSQSSWVVSIIELGNVLTPLPTGLLVDIWGRKPLLQLAAPLFIFSWALVLTTRSVLVLFIVRFIQGIGIGVVFTVLPTYLGEISAPSLRGTLGTLFEVMWYLGVLLQYCLAPAVSYHTLAACSFCVPVLYLVAFLPIPESPYFLLLVGEDEDALLSLLWLRGADTSRQDVETELLTMKISVQEDLAQRSCNSWADLVATPASRRCLLIVQVVLVMEVVTGIPAILSYVTEALSKTHGQSLLKPDQYTVLFGVGILASTLVSAVMVDSVGRRPILLTSCLGATLCQLASALFFYLDSRTDLDVSGHSWIVVLSLTMYGVLLCGGCGAVSTSVQSELFPSHTRGLGNGVTTMVVSVASFFCLKLYEDVENSVGIYLNFLLYAMCGLLGSVFLYLFMPETKGRTFAEIQLEMNKLNALTERVEDKLVKVI